MKKIILSSLLVLSTLACAEDDYSVRLSGGIASASNFDKLYTFHHKTSKLRLDPYRMNRHLSSRIHDHALNQNEDGFHHGTWFEFGKCF